MTEARQDQAGDEAMRDLNRKMSEMVHRNAPPTTDTGQEQSAGDVLPTKEDSAWGRIFADDRLKRARKNLSAHEIVLMIKHAQAGWIGTVDSLTDELERLRDARPPPPQEAEANQYKQALRSIEENGSYPAAMMARNALGAAASPQEEQET